MCQNLLAFLKDNCPLSTTSITASNALDVHLSHCVKLGTLFIIVGFSTCVGIIGGRFHYWWFVGLVGYFISCKVEWTSWC
jgi:hypothetical protein